MITIESTTVERLLVPLTTSADPTGANPEFQVVTGGDPGGSWTAGTWDTGWTSSNGRIDALTPTLGASGADLAVEDGSEYTLWVRWTVGSETPVKRAGLIKVV